MSEAREFSFYFILKQATNLESLANIFNSEFSKMGKVGFTYRGKNGVEFGNPHNFDIPTKMLEVGVEVQLSEMFFLINIDRDNYVVHIFTYHSDLTDWRNVSLREKAWTALSKSLEMATEIIGHDLLLAYGGSEGDVTNFILNNGFLTDKKFKPLVDNPQWFTYVDNSIIEKFGRKKVLAAPYWKKKETKNGIILYLGKTSVESDSTVVTNYFALRKSEAD